MLRGLFLFLVVLLPLQSASARTLNGFDLSDSLIPAAEILPGGPPRDGIPAIDAPRFEPASDRRWLAGDALVLGLALHGEAKAYPLAIMNWHEVVNDRLAGEAVVITYCPLCGSGMAFSAQLAGQALQFGVSGLLYNSDVLLYDRQSESLWSQLRAEAVTGPLKGQRLETLPLELQTLADWRARYPHSLLLSRDTGHRRDYDRDPYGGYARSGSLYFPVAFRSQRYHPKERVLGLSLNGRHKAYPFSELAKAGGNRLQDRFAGQTLTLEFDAEKRTGRVLDADGTPLPAVNAFWFAWYGFHPEGEVFKADGAS